MLDAAVLRSIANQLTAGRSVSVGAARVAVRQTSRQRLRTASFRLGDHAYEALGQNPEKPSR